MKRIGSIVFALLFAALLLLPLGCKKESESERSGASVLAKTVTVNGEETPNCYAWYYHLQNDGTAMLDTYVCLQFHLTLTLPEKVDGIRVTALSRNAFRDEDFYCTEIVIPDGITRIEGNPFYGQTMLSRITVSETHLTLEVRDGALFDKQENRLIVAFASAEGQRIPEGTEIVEDYAFYNTNVCPTQVTIPESVKTIGHNPFCRRIMRRITVAEGNGNYEMRDGFLYDKREERLIIATSEPYEERLAEHKSEEIRCDIPDGTKCIDDFAFYALSERQGRHRFVFVIPDSVEEIGMNPFRDSEIAFSAENAAFEITGNLLYSRKDRRVICSVQTDDGFTIPEDAEIIGDYALLRTEEDVILPESVREIGTHAFYGNGTVRVPETVRRIGADAFKCGIKDEKLILSGKVSVGSHAFSGVITEIVVGDGDAILHSQMLEYQTATDTLLEKVSIGKGKTVVGWSAFGKNNAEFTVYHDTDAERYVKENNLQYRYAD